MGRIRSLISENDWTAKHLIRAFGKTRFTKRELIADRTFAITLITIMTAYWTYQWENDIGRVRDMFDFKADIDAGALDYVRNFYQNTVVSMEADDTIEMDTRGNGVDVFLVADGTSVTGKVVR